MTGSMAVAAMLGIGIAQAIAPGSPPVESAAAMRKLEARPAGVQGAGPLAALGFMAGCWRTVPGSTAVLEEYYTAPSANVIVGVSRELRGGRTVQFEFTRITADGTGVVLLPHPGGRPSAHGFRLTQSAPGHALFEAPEHDFPKRIRYSLGDDGTLTARIDGGEGDTRVQEWRMRQVACSAGVSAAGGKQ